MNSSLGLEQQVALKLIFNDVIFARRHMQGAITRAAETQVHVPVFCMQRYISLYVYESHKALAAVAPVLADQLTVDNAQVIERSRHTMKLFDDSNAQIGGAAGVTSQFEDIAGAHQDYFLDNTWFPPAKILETDLAVYRYRGRLVTTSHAISFHLGLPTVSTKDKAAEGLALMSLSKGQAAYIASIADGLAWRGMGPSFTDVLDLAAVKNKDIRASRFYRSAFDNGLSDKATAALVAFQCSMNFLAVMVAEEPSPDSAEATFKLKLLTLYHVLSSLAKFKAAFGSSLSHASKNKLDVILGNPVSVELTDVSKRGLRNTLMHYVPRGSIVAQLSPSRPLCGLVEAHYPNYNYPDMKRIVDEHTQLVAELLDDWAAQR